jgi:hypothetical protein
MLTFLFWNLDGRAIPNVVANLARRHDVDVLMLAECAIPVPALLQELNRGNPSPYREPDSRSICERILLVPRFSPQLLLRRAESPYYTCRLLRRSGRPELTLFVVHLGSKLFQSDASQSLAMPGLSAVVRSVEKRVGRERTMVVGDLNMNPFEAGIAGAEGLHAVMTREIAQKGRRRVAGVDHPFFYNPMWGHFGDRTHTLHPPGTPEHDPPGTCYYPARESRWYFWNMYDQVLLRPSLLPFFRNDELKIVTRDGVTSFLDQNGHPDRKVVSDHLPLLFRLRI